MSSLLHFRRAGPLAPVEDAPLSALPTCEAVPLSTLRKLFDSQVLSPDANILAHDDPWIKLPEDNIQCLCLRFLRFQLLNVDAAIKHIMDVAQWRAKENPWSPGMVVTCGPPAGLPILQVPGKGTDGEVLLFSSARFYIRSQVDHAAQEGAIKMLFENLMYLKNGPRALSSVMVIDFEGMSMKNIDLVATKNGIRIFADYYPELFKKILIVNYPRWLHGTWKIVKALLDARTIAKVVWVSDGKSMRSELERYFKEKDIPRWLGGKGPDGDMTLYTEAIVNPDEIARSVQ